MPQDRFDEVLDAVDGLAQASAKNFGSVEARLDKIEDRLDSLENKIDTVESNLSAKLTNLQNRQDVFAGLDRKVDIMDIRLTKVEKTAA